jgi:hypothetical protein
MEKNQVLLIIATLILLVCCSGVQGTASNLLKLEGSYGWTQHIKVVQGATAYLVVLPSKKGTGVLIDRYPDGSEHNYDYYFFGCDRLLFNADAPGRHVLSYIIDDKESNTVVIDVIGICAPTDHPTPRVATQKVTLEPTVTFPSPVTFVSLSRGIPSAVNCDDGDPCTVDSCGPDDCIYALVNCDDGNPCTVDSCGPDGCIHAPVNCDDGNPCTVDSCGPNGCVHVAVNCDDGNPCTVDSCGPNGCVHVAVNCDDGNPCTVDSCGPNGCVHVAVNCDDANPCTVDSCSENGCVHAPVNCDDANPCTVDSCSENGCVHAPVNCDDGHP